MFPTTEYFCVEKDGYQGVINKKGQVIVPIGIYHVIKHKEVSCFDEFTKEYHSNENWLVSSYEKQGILDENGKTIVPADKYTFVDTKVDELGNRAVRYGKYDGLIDKKGNSVIPTDRYTSIVKVLREDAYFVWANGKKGLCNKNGVEIIPPLYTDIKYRKFDYIKVSDGEKKGLYDPNGKLILPALFSKIEITDGRITAWDNEEKIELDADNNIITAAQNQSEFELSIWKGDNALYKNNFTEALKHYKNALQYQESDYVNYYIGITYYNLGQYEDAILWFRKCISNNPSQTIKDYAKDMIIDSQRCIKNERQAQQQLQEKQKQQVAQAILGGLLGFASSFIQTRTMNYNNPNNNNYFNSFAYFSNSQGQNYDYLLNPNYAIQQVEQQNQLEYYEFSQWFKKPDGSDYSYMEFMDMKLQAWQASQTSDGNTVNSSNSSTSTSSNPRQIEYYDKDCHLCHGSGKCSSCNGTHYMDYQFGPGKIECPNCKPNGACSACGGTGKIRSMRLN